MADTVVNQDAKSNKKQSDLGELLHYAGQRRGLTFVGLFLSAVAMFIGMLALMFIFDWRAGAQWKSTST